MKTFQQFLDESQKRTHEFSSTHILLPHELAQSVIHWGKEEISDEDLFHNPEDPEFGREMEPHVTALYGLVDTKADKFKEFFSNQKTISIKLSRISLFSNEKFDVVKIEVISPGMRELNTKLKEEFPFHQMNPYRPHVTIAYVKKGKGKKFDGSDFFVGQTFKAKEIIFSSRDGIKTTFPLGKSK